MGQAAGIGEPVEAALGGETGVQHRRSANGTSLARPRAGAGAPGDRRPCSPGSGEGKQQQISPSRRSLQGFGLWGELWGEL
jgi:hypothetical protein